MGMVVGGTEERRELRGAPRESSDRDEGVVIY